MNVFRIWFLLGIFLLPMNNILAEPNVGRVPGIKFVFPINEQKQMALIIQIPKNFRPLQKIKNQNLNDKEIFFIPVSKVKSSQKESILLIPKLNSGLSAEKILEKFTAQFKKSAQKMVVLKEQKKEYDGFVHAAKLIMYEYKNEVELVNTYAISGPKHLVILQYSIKIQNNTQVKPAVNKMLTFFNGNVKIRKQAIIQPKIKLKDSV